MILTLYALSIKRKRRKESFTFKNNLINLLFYGFKVFLSFLSFTASFIIVNGGNLWPMGSYMTSY